MFSLTPKSLQVTPLLQAVSPVSPEEGDREGAGHMSTSVQEYTISGGVRGLAAKENTESTENKN